MRIAVLDDYGAEAPGLADWSRLGARAEPTFFARRLATPEALVEALAGFDAVVLTRERTAMPAEVIARLPRLRLIVTTGKGNSRLDMAAATAAGIQVCGTVTLGHPTAELTWGLVIGLLRHIPKASAELGAGTWLPRAGESLKGRTLGLLGLGRIGSRVARVGLAFEMEVVAWSQNLSPARAAEVGVRHVDRQTLFRASDVLSVHVGLERYRNAVGAAEFALMKRTALFVNTSRAGIVDEAALLDALRRRAIGGAAVDVYHREPPEPGYELLRLDNVLATPHLGYATRDNLGEGFRQALDCIEAFLDGRLLRPLNEVPRAP